MLVPDGTGNPMHHQIHPRQMTREEKIERYIDTVVQDMDMKTMYLCLCDFLYEDLKHESDEEIDQRYNEYFGNND